MHSVDLPLNVAGQQQASPEQEQNQQTVEQDSGTQMEYLYAAVGIIAIAAIAAAAYLFFKRRNRSSPITISD
jgi:LPXTG-motif cell wall-anchored protein